MNYLLAVDQGTSSTRAMIYNEKGQLIVSSQYPITQYYPQSGWVEHDPEEIWSKTLAAMRDVVSQVQPNQLLACGITNQRETSLIWNKKTGACLAPAIVWQDRRTAQYCDSLAHYAPMIQEKTGLMLDSYFSATKLHWFLENNQEARKLARVGDLAFGTIDSFLVWRMTKGAHLTDSTNASRTMLFNIKEEQWDNDLLQLFSIPESVLPQVYSSDANFGLIHKEHLGFELPITGVAGDQHAALIGQGCFNEGEIKVTFGTGAFLLLNTGAHMIPSKNRLLTSIAYKIKDQTVYGLEGSIYHAGTTIKWLRDEMKLLSCASESESLAQSLSSNEGVYLVSSFTGLGAPHWLSTPGAVISGISRTTNRAHFARAALEGVCYQTRDVLECMRDESPSDISLLRADGGMAQNQWFLQFLADQCQLTVQRPKDIETTARGAALLAGIGCGLFGSLSELNNIKDVEQEYLISRTMDEVARDYSGWASALSKIG